MQYNWRSLYLFGRIRDPERVNYLCIGTRRLQLPDWFRWRNGMLHQLRYLVFILKEFLLSPFIYLAFCGLGQFTLRTWPYRMWWSVNHTTYGRCIRISLTWVPPPLLATYLGDFLFHPVFDLSTTFSRWKNQGLVILKSFLHNAAFILFSALQTELWPPSYRIS